MSAEDLADVVRWVGVVVAFVASFLAAPTATRHIVAVVTGRSVVVWTVTRAQVRRVWARLTGRSVGRTVSVSGIATVGAVGRVTATFSSSWNVDADADIESRVGRLEQRVVELGTAVTTVKTEAAKNASQHREAIAGLGQRLTDEAAAIRRSLAEREEEKTRVDAAALPVVGLGIVLSGVPEYLATWTWLGVLSILLALGFLHWALMRFWARAPGSQVAG